MLLALFGLLVSRLRIGWAKALFIVFTLHVYLAHLRFMYLFFLLVPVVIAVEVAQQYPSLSATAWLAEKRDGLEKFFARRFYAICGAAAVLLVGAVAVLGSAYQVAPSPKTSASGALAFAEGPSFVRQCAEFLRFRRHADFPRHQDLHRRHGRTSCSWAVSQKPTTRREHSDGKPLLEAQLKKYAIGWALLSAGDNRIPFFDELGWKRAYSDDYAVIYLPGA